MTLTVGSTLACFEILAKLGEGGMGEVFRARDTELGREVAIKVLPAEMAADPDRLDRFRREAQSVAALKHSNIVTIHSVQEDRGVHFLVLELIEGQSLDRILPPSGFRLEKIFELAIPIADALAAAHEAGITHRDLKPANVMVTEEGGGRPPSVKILDFGLAKLAEKPGDEEETELLTQAGALLGTVPYMSPEQVQGREVDHRTDIFSFGVLLYEMATGRRPFGGEDPASVISSILRDQPRPITELKTDLPNHLGRIVRRCLEKDPERRLHSAREARIELEDLRQEVAAAADERRQEAAARAREREETARETAALLEKRKRRQQGLAAALVVAFLAAAGAGVLIGSWFGGDEGAPSPKERVVSNLLPPPGYRFNGVDGPPVFTRDGRRLAFLAARPGEPTYLFVRSLERGEARRLEGTADARMPFWSPDGKFLAFFSDGKLRKLDPEGGLPQALADAPEPSGGSWSTRGQILFFADYSRPPRLVDENGGLPRELPEPYPGRLDPWYDWPQFLPDGDHFTFALQDLGGSESGIHLASLSEPGAPHRLSRTISRVTYVDRGWLLFCERGAVVAYRFDPERAELEEERLLVVDNVAWGQYLAYGRFAVSQNGFLVYQPGDGGIGDTELVRVDRSGGRRTVVEPRAEYYTPRIAGDGSRIAVDITDIQTTHGDIWVLDPDRNTRTRLTRDPLDESSPVWAADDSAIFFMRVPDVLSRDVQAAQEARVVFESEWSTRPDDLSPDGQHLLIRVETPDKGYDIWVVDPASGEGEAWLEESYNEANARFSPDGRWVAYQTDESGRFEISVRSFPDGLRREVVSTEGGEGPVWRRDGGELFYYSAAGEITAVAVDRSSSVPAFGEPEPLFATRLRVEKTEFDVYPDGQTFLLNELIPDTDDLPMVLVEGWDSALPE